MGDRAKSEIENGILKLDAAPAQLYNLEADPNQKTNLFFKETKITTSMKKF